MAEDAPDELSDLESRILARLGGSPAPTGSVPAAPAVDPEVLDGRTSRILEALGAPPPEVPLVPAQQPRNRTRRPGRISRSGAELLDLIQEGTIEGVDLCVRIIKGEEKVTVVTRTGDVREVDVEAKDRLRAVEIVTKFGFKLHEAEAQAERDKSRKALTEAQKRDLQAKTLERLLRAAQAKRAKREGGG